MTVKTLSLITLGRLSLVCAGQAALIATLLTRPKRSLALPGDRLLSALILLLVIFSFQIPQSRGQSISIAIVQPCCSNFLTHEDLGVTVQVSSTYQLQSVLAFVEDRTNQLAFSSDYCRGFVNLAGLTRANKVLTVVATDVFGN